LALFHVFANYEIRREPHLTYVKPVDRSSGIWATFRDRA